MSADADKQEATEILEWLRSFGDPNDGEYLSLDEINAGFELIDALKARVDPEEAMTVLLRFFGFHPPSMIEYADNLGVDLIRSHKGPAFAWLDGLVCGAGMVVMAINMRDQEEGHVA